MFFDVDLEQFAAARGERLERSDTDLTPFVATGLTNFGQTGWSDEIVDMASVLWLEIFEQEKGDEDYTVWFERFRENLTDALAKTSRPGTPPDPAQVERVTFFVSTFTANHAAYSAARRMRAAGMQWVSRHDEEVRTQHRAADGQIVSVGGTFNIGGHRLRFPGDPVGPPETWINCRCLLRPVRRDEAVTASMHVFDLDSDLDPDVEVGIDDFDEDELVDADEVPIHGVLAPEGVPTGDGRMFAVDALTNRDLPLPLLYQLVSGGSHNNAVVAARIDEIFRVGNEVRFRGMIPMGTEHAEALVYGIASGLLRGVSVDLDLAEEYRPELPEEPTDADLAAAAAEYLEATGGHEGVTLFTMGRVAGATIVALPAFQEAYLALGHTFADEISVEELDALAASAEDDCVDCVDWAVVEVEWWDFLTFAIDEGEWDGAASNFTDEEWFESTLIHLNGNSRVKSDNKLPVFTPSGDLSRRGVHAAAARLNQVDAPDELIAKARRALVALYKQLGEEAPPSLTASVIIVDDHGQYVNMDSKVEHGEFAPGTRDGPGWLTNPADAQRLRRYWTRGEGAAKIRWGQPGDFNRCRRQLAKYVNPAFLSGTCANLHKVALGIWPGQHRGQGASLAASALPWNIQASPAFRLTVAESELPPKSWFENPRLTQPTGITITDEGRIYGHIAAWGVCHIGIPGVCTVAPKSATSYAFYRTGLVNTQGGMVEVGQITMDTGHAGRTLRSKAAAGHYDHTGYVVADVAAGEDEHGIWFAGALREGVSPKKVAELQAGSLSGDWREIRGNLELVAALVVNVPGFPIPRTSIAASAGHQTSLVAAGIVSPVAPLMDVKFDLTIDDIDVIVDAIELKRAAKSERAERVSAAKQALAPAVEEHGQKRAARIAAARETLSEGIL